MYQKWTAFTKLAKQMNQEIVSGGGGDILLKLSKQSIYIQNKGARDMLNKHGILLTESFCNTLDYQISYLAIANIWGRYSVAYGLTSSHAC